MTRWFSLHACVRTLWFAVALFAFGGCGGDSAQSFFDQADDYLAEGEYDKAIAAVESGLDLDPTSAVGFSYMGMAYRMKFNALRATEWKKKEIDAFRQAIAADSTFWQARINLGATFYYLGKKAEAAPHFVKALELYPENPERAQIEQFIREGGGEVPAAN